MTTLWSEIRSDVAFRHHLLYPDGNGQLGWMRVWLPSRGIMSLAVQRPRFRVIDEMVPQLAVTRRRRGREFIRQLSIPHDAFVAAV